MKKFLSPFKDSFSFDHLFGFFADSPAAPAVQGRAIRRRLLRLEALEERTLLSAGSNAVEVAAAAEQTGSASPGVEGLALLPTGATDLSGIAVLSGSAELRMTSVQIDNASENVVYAAYASYYWDQYREVTTYRRQAMDSGTSMTWLDNGLCKTESAGLAFDSAGDTRGYRTVCGNVTSEAVFVTAGGGKNSVSLFIDMDAPTQNEKIKIGTSGACAYQWYRGYNVEQWSQISSMTPISGATSPSYTPNQTDVGYYLKCTITYYSGYAASSCSVITGKPVAASSTQTTNTPISGVSISGTLAENSILSANVTPSGATYSCQWFGGTSPDSMSLLSSSKTYQLKTADIGKFIKCVVTGTGNYAGTDDAVSGSRVVATQKSITRLTLSSGSPVLGTIIKASVEPSGATVTYKWFQDSSSIVIGTSSSYEVKATDVGHALRCTVSGTGEYTGTKSLTTNVVTNNLPDLTFEAGSWSQSILFSTALDATVDSSSLPNTENIYANVHVANTGNQSVSSSFTIKVYLDGTLIRNKTWDSDLEKNHVYVYGNILLNRDLYGNTTTLSSGNHILRVELDTGGVIGESNENNNVASRTFTVTTGTTPDLSTSNGASLSISSVTKGDSFRLSDVSVRNVGTRACGTYTIRYYASSNTTINTSDTLLYTDSGRSGMEVGGKVAASAYLSSSSLVAGTWYIGWIITVDGPETSTGNNTGYCTTSLTVVAPSTKKSDPLYYLSCVNNNEVQVEIIGYGVTNGYELQFSTSSYFSGTVRTITYSDATGTKYIYNLTSNTRYYFRMRALGSSSAYNSNYVYKDIFVKGVPTGYNANDYSKLRAFLEYNGNGSKLYSGYDANSPETWIGVTWSSSSTNKRATSIFWYNKGLSGNLDVSDFTGLTSLLCTEGTLTQVNTKNATALEKLDVTWNSLSSLDVSGNRSLKELYCQINDFSSIDISKNVALTYFACSSRHLSSIDLSTNVNLQSLKIECTDITSLDLSHNTSLRLLNCCDNRLSSIDVSGLAALEFFDCSANQLTSLDLTGNTVLESLYCENNKLTTLDLSKNTKLESLCCYNNQLSALDLTRNTALTGLNTWSKTLKTVFLSSSSIGRLYLKAYRSGNAIWTYRDAYGNVLSSDSYEYLLSQLPVFGTNNDDESQSIAFKDPSVPVSNPGFVTTGASTAGTVPLSLNYSDTFSLSTSLIKNRGTKASGSFEVEFYAATSSDNLFTSSAVLLGTKTMSSLSSGSTTTASLSGISVAGNLSTGISYYFGWKIVSASDSDSSDNTASYTDARTILKAPVKIVSATIRKAYDGSTGLSLSDIQNPVLSGVRAADSITLSYVEGYYGGANVGTQTVTITSGTLSGANSEYYIFEQLSNLSGEITAPAGIYLCPPDKTFLTANGSTSLTVSWESVSNASGYEIEYASNSAFTSGLGSITVSSGTLTRPIPGLSANTVTYVRVRSLGDGTWYKNSEYSSIVLCKTLPQPPTMLGCDAKTSNSISLVWTESVGDADFYVLEYSLDGVSSWTPVEEMILGPSYVHTPLQSNTTYFYRLRAMNSSGVSDAASLHISTCADGVSFVDQVGDKRDTALLISLSENRFTFTDKLGEGVYDYRDVDIYKWIVSSSDVGKEHVFVTSRPEGGTSVDTYLRLFDASSTGATTELARDDDSGGNRYSRLAWTPTAAGTYYLGVSCYANKTYNPMVAGSSESDGTRGDYTLTVLRMIKLSTPTLSVTATGSDSVSARVGVVSYHSGYILEYSPQSDFSSVETKSLTSSGTYPVSGLEPHTKYYFRVRAVGTGTYTDSDWSDPQSTTTGTITLSSPSLDISAVGAHSISVVIGSVPNATTYVLEYATSSLYTSSTTEVLSQDGATTIKGLWANRTYYLRVKAVGSSSCSDSSWKEANAKTEVDNEYNQTDCDSIRAFLELADENGVKNGTRINSSAYAVGDPSSWDGVEWEVFDGLKRAVNIYWDGYGLFGTLNLSACAQLKFLMCSSNPRITGLNLSGNKALTRLLCSSCGLTTLDLSNNSALDEISCYSNHITELDISKNGSLRSISCWSPELTTVTVPSGVPEGSPPYINLYFGSETEWTLKDASGTVLWHDRSYYSLFNMVAKAPYTAVNASGTQTINFVGSHCLSDVLTLRRFLEQEDEQGIKNGKKLSDDYSPYVASSWPGIKWSTDDGPKQVKEIYWENRGLAGVLDLSGCESLERLSCCDNHLVSLDVSRNLQLYFLCCSGNEFTTLNLSKNLNMRSLFCHNNNLSTVILHPSVVEQSMRYFPYCDGYQISAPVWKVNNCRGETEKTIYTYKADGWVMLEPVYVTELPVYVEKIDGTQSIALITEDLVPLASPQTLLSTDGTGSLFVSVTPVEHATGYRLEYSSSPEFTSVTSLTVAAGITTISGLDQSETCYVRAKSLGDEFFVESPYEKETAWISLSASMPSVTVSQQSQIIQEGDSFWVDAKITGGDGHGTWRVLGENVNFLVDGNSTLRLSANALGLRYGEYELYVVREEEHGTMTIPAVFTLTVEIAAPCVHAELVSLLHGEIVKLNMSAFYPSGEIPHLWFVDWGDGSECQEYEWTANSLSVVHYYGSSTFAMLYDVTLVLVDVDIDIDTSVWYLGSHRVPASAVFSASVPGEAPVPEDAVVGVTGLSGSVTLSGLAALLPDSRIRSTVSGATRLSTLPDTPLQVGSSSPVWERPLLSVDESGISTARTTAPVAIWDDENDLDHLFGEPVEIASRSEENRDSLLDSDIFADNELDELLIPCL